MSEATFGAPSLVATISDGSRPKLTEAQASVLVHLRRHHAWYPGKGWIWENQSTTVRHLNALVRKGYATRVQTGDWVEWYLNDRRHVETGPAGRSGAGGSRTADETSQQGDKKMDIDDIAPTVRYISDALVDNAHRFTCSEAEAVCDLFELVGLTDLVDVFRTAHAEQDEPYDFHKVVDGVGVYDPPF